MGAFFDLAEEARIILQVTCAEQKMETRLRAGNLSLPIVMAK